jgi:hypothetical protein
MDAVPVEPKDSRRVLCLAVDVAAYSPTVDRNLLRQQMRSLRDATLSALAFRERLNESEAEDGPLVLHLTGHGIRPAASRPDLAVGNLLVECKSWYDPNAAAYGLPKSDGLVPPWVEWHDEPGAPWQALPHYAARPLTVSSCCGSSELTPEAVAAAQTRKKMMPIPATAGKTEPLLHVATELWSVAPVSLTVIIQDKQIAEDYRQGLRCFVDVVLDVLGRMVVMVLAALSRLAQPPSFPLVMLAVARHYGRRGEPDDHAPLITRVHPIRPPGAACVAT